MLTWLWLVISALLLILSVVLQIGEVGNAGSMLTSGGTDFDRVLRCTSLRECTTLFLPRSLIASSVFAYPLSNSRVLGIVVDLAGAGDG